MSDRLFQNKRVGCLSIILFSLVFLCAGSLKAFEWSIDPGTGNAIVNPAWYADINMQGQSIAIHLYYRIPQEPWYFYVNFAIMHFGGVSGGLNIPQNDFPPINVNSTPLPIPLRANYVYDGTFNVFHQVTNNILVTSSIFPAHTINAAIEEWTIQNMGGTPVTIDVASNRQILTNWPNWTNQMSVIERTITGISGQVLNPGEKTTCAILYTVRATIDPVLTVNVAQEKIARQTMFQKAQTTMVLQTPEPILNGTFGLAKMRVLESPALTSEGVINTTGAGYFPGMWANDNVEYASPVGPYLGDSTLTGSFTNMYRVWMLHCLLMRQGLEYPGSTSWINSQFTGYEMGHWGGGGRGDNAMTLYGISRFLLALGDNVKTLQYWPLVSTAVTDLIRNMNAGGTINSASDELEGRYPTGTANLSTSALAFAGLRSASRVAAMLGKTIETTNYYSLGTALSNSIESYFGATVEGYQTYQYYQGCTVLRGWLSEAMCAGLMQRGPATMSALMSPSLWYDDGANCGTKVASTDPGGGWPRETYYTLRAAFQTGNVDWAVQKTLLNAEDSMLQGYGPYIQEDGGDLLSPNVLYVRVFTEGMFGIDPRTQNIFACTPRMPSTWPSMSLHNICMMGGRYADINVDRTNSLIRLTVLRSGMLIFRQSGPDGTIFLVNLNGATNRISLSSQTATPSTVSNNKPRVVVFNCHALVTNAMISNVKLNLVNLGGPASVLMTNLPGSNYRYAYTVPALTSSGGQTVSFIASDNRGNQMTGTTTVTVLNTGTGIVVTNISDVPSSATNNNNKLVVFTLKSKGLYGSSISNVSLNLAQVGGPAQVKMTNISGATSFRYSCIIPLGLQAGVKTVKVTSMNSFGNRMVISNLYFTVLAPPSGIVVTNIFASPTNISNNINRIVTFYLTAKDVLGGSITNVSLDLTQVGGPAVAKMTNISGATSYRYSFNVFAGLSAGVKTVPITAIDNNGNPDISNHFTLAVVVPPSGIVVTNISPSPATVSNNANHVVVFLVTGKDVLGGSITNVTLNLSQLGGSAVTKMTNISGATQYRYSFTVGAGLMSGIKSIPITAWDNAGNSDMTHNATITVVAMSGPGKSYYLNGDSLIGDRWCTAVGNDANTGLNPANPRRTFGSLISSYTLRAGDTVYVDTGTYNEAVNITSADSGNPSADLRFLASTNNGGAIMNWPSGAPLTFNGCSHVVFDGFHIRGSKPTGNQGVYFQNGAHFNTLRNCRIYSNNNIGVDINSSSSNMIYGCEIWGNLYFGIGSGSSDGITVTRCYIHDNGNEGIRVTGPVGWKICQNLFYRDYTDSEVLLNPSSGSALHNNTFISNTKNFSSGNVAIGGVAVDLRDCVSVYGRLGGGAGYNAWTSPQIVTWSCAWTNNQNFAGTASAGMGSITVNPLFYAYGQDYHFRWNSPVISAGSNRNTMGRYSCSVHPADVTGNTVTSYTLFFTTTPAGGIPSDGMVWLKFPVGFSFTGTSVSSGSGWGGSVGSFIAQDMGGGTLKITRSGGNVSMPDTTERLVLNGINNPSSSSSNYRIWWWTTGSDGSMIDSPEDSNPFRAGIGGLPDTTPPTAAILVTPVSNVLMTNCGPNLLWRKSTDTGSGVAGYTVQMSSNGFTSVGRTANTGTGTTNWTVTPILTPGTWLWKVISRDGAGNTNISSVWIYTISTNDITPPSAAILVAPVSNTLSTNKSPNLVWKKSTDTGSGVGGYTVQMSSNGFSTVGRSANTGIAVTNWNVIPALADGTWTWKVISRDLAGNTNISEIWTYKVDHTLPGIPVLAGPANASASSNNRPVFIWNKAMDANGITNYRVEISSNGFASIQRTWAGPNSVTTNWQATPVLGDSVWSWRVYASDKAGNWSPASAIRTLTIDRKAPSLVTLLSPVSNSVSPSLSVTLMWNAGSDSLSGISNYIVQMATVPNFAGAVTVVTNGTSCHLTLSAGTTNWWKVRAVDKALNMGAWSSAWIVVTTNGSVPHNPAEITNYLKPSIYPTRFNMSENPKANIYCGGSKGNVAVKAYDLTGYLMKDFGTRKGTDIISWDGKGDSGAFLQSGVYVIRFSGKGFDKIIKFMVVK